MLQLRSNKVFWALSLISGGTLALGWVPLPFPFLLFMGFVPLLLIEELLSRRGGARTALVFFEYAYVAFLLWNALTTWWLYFASFAGAAVAIIANAFLMCLPFLLFQQTKKRLGAVPGYLSLPVYWLAFEFGHHNWELAWPWLTLGNGLAKFPEVIQWYEYTGVLGGSLWILIVNLLLFAEVRKFLARRQQKTPHAGSALAYGLGVIGIVALVPVVGSLAIYANYRDSGRQKQVVIVQPNVDPYTEKFSKGSADKYLRRLLKMSQEHVTPEIDFFVWPETALTYALWVDRLASHRAVKTLQQFVKSTPNARLITGIYAYQRYDSKDASPTARKLRRSPGYYDAFNTAMQVDTSGELSVYHKSKLVPGVERLPYPGVFRFLEQFALELGGISGSLGTQKTRDVFFSNHRDGIAPVICYESVFGEYVAKYIRNGAEAIFIITNDGWWGNTAGHVQHLYFASLRAIETRKSIARSANTGISCFVNQRGDILQATRYNEQTAIEGTVFFNRLRTFYTQHGDYLGRGAALLTAFFFIALLINTLGNRKKKATG